MDNIYQYIYIYWMGLPENPGDSRDIWLMAMWSCPFFEAKLFRPTIWMIWGTRFRRAQHMDNTYAKYIYIHSLSTHAHWYSISVHICMCIYIYGCVIMYVYTPSTYIYIYSVHTMYRCVKLKYHIEHQKKKSNVIDGSTKNAASYPYIVDS